MKITSALAVLTLAAGVGCAHANPTVASTTTDDTTRKAPVAQEVKATPAPVAAAEPASEQLAQQSLQAAVDDLKGTRIFFSYDDDLLTPEGRTKLTAISSILAKHPKLHIRVEGNADERGTEAYNLVLGQRRADATRKYLVQLGAHEDQVNTLTYGEENPVAKDHSEQAWQQNRRADVVVLPMN
jgi:peptidoglycan-associated lipoprotein